MAKSILGDLYCARNANINNVKVTPEYEEARSNYTEIQNTFLKGLTDGQKEDYDNLFDKIILAESLWVEHNFQEGFKLGLKIGVEVFKD